MFVRLVVLSEPRMHKFRAVIKSINLPRRAGHIATHLVPLSRLQIEFTMSVQFNVYGIHGKHIRPLDRLSARTLLSKVKGY